MKVSTKLNSLALAAALLMPFAANAESNFQTGAGTPLTATAHVDFTIIVPKILYLRVGTGTAGATNGAIDLITFTVPAASVGNGTPIAGTGGDLTGGVVTAIVQGNNGTVTLNATSGGALTNATADTINYTQIVTTPTALAGFGALLNPPVLVNGASANITINPATSKVVSSGPQWTYSYLNTNVVAPGTYGGAGVNNGRVTYTASMP